MLANSAPLNPGVRTLIFFANSSIENSCEIYFLKMNFNISNLLKLGRCISIDLSNLTGLSRVGASESLRLVAAITIILYL